MLAHPEGLGVHTGLRLRLKATTLSPVVLTRLIAQRARAERIVDPRNRVPAVRGTPRDGRGGLDAG